jgi:hypothetical protein
VPSSESAKESLVLRGAIHGHEADMTPSIKILHLTLMNKTLTLNLANIRNIDELYDFFEVEFVANGITYFEHNLDSLEEIITEYDYEVVIDDLELFLQIFAIEASREYFDDYQIDHPTLGEMLLEIFRISVPKCLDVHRQIGHYSGYKTRVFATFFLSIEAEEDLPRLHEAYQFSHAHHLPFVIIGGGTNLLFARSYFS